MLIGKPNIVKMAVLSKFFYILNIIPIKFPHAFIFLAEINVLILKFKWKF